MDECAYRYPSSNRHWKNTMQVPQTAAAPPSEGSISLAIIGWIRKSRVALVKILVAYGAVRAALESLRAGVNATVAVAIGLRVNPNTVHFGGADHRLLWSAAFGGAGRRQKPIVCPTETP